MSATKRKRYAGLKKYCLGLGVDLFGVADISGIRQEFDLSPEALGSCSAAVCLGMRLSGRVLAELHDAPTRLYFHHYRTLNAVLDQTALRLASLIQREGFSALPVPASQIVDWENQKAHLSHKKLGYLAGLGWIGRNNLLVNPALGAQFRLVSVLTDMPLAFDAPLAKDCAGCRLCVKACPCGAVAEDAASFDHRRCFEQLKLFQKKRLTDQYICGVCVNVCRGKKGVAGRSR